MRYSCDQMNDKVPCGKESSITPQGSLEAPQSIRSCEVHETTDKCSEPGTEVDQAKLNSISDKSDSVVGGGEALPCLVQETKLEKPNTLESLQSQDANREVSPCGGVSSEAHKKGRHSEERKRTSNSRSDSKPKEGSEPGVPRRDRADAESRPCDSQRSRSASRRVSASLERKRSSSRGRDGKSPRGHNGSRGSHSRDPAGSGEAAHAVDRSKRERSRSGGQRHSDRREGERSYSRERSRGSLRERSRSGGRDRSRSGGRERSQHSRSRHSRSGSGACEAR